MAQIKTIVIIEDDTELAELVKMSLSGIYDIRCFEGPDEALAYIQDNQVHAVIVDYYLKETTGLSAISDILKDHFNLPMILVSADESVEEKLSGFEHRYISFLKKPFLPHELNRSLVELQRRTNLLPLTQVRSNEKYKI